MLPSKQIDQAKSASTTEQQPVWQRKVLLFIKDIGWPLAFLAALSSVALGITGFGDYYAEGGQSLSWLDRLFMSIKLFAMEFEFIENAQIISIGREINRSDRFVNLKYFRPVRRDNNHLIRFPPT